MECPIFCFLGDILHSASTPKEVREILGYKRRFDSAALSTRKYCCHMWNHKCYLLQMFASPGITRGWPVYKRLQNDKCCRNLILQSLDGRRKDEIRFYVPYFVACWASDSTSPSLVSFGAWKQLQYMDSGRATHSLNLALANSNSKNLYWHTQEAPNKKQIHRKQ